MDDKESKGGDKRREYGCVDRLLGLVVGLVGGHCATEIYILIGVSHSRWRNELRRGEECASGRVDGVTHS